MDDREKDRVAIGPLRKLMCWCVKITKRYPENRGGFSHPISWDTLGNQERASGFQHIPTLFGPLRAIEKPWKWYPTWFIGLKSLLRFFFLRITRSQSGYWWTNHTVNQNQQVSSGIMGWKKHGVIRPEIRRVPCHQICALQPTLPDLFEATDVRRPFGEVLQLISKFYSWLVVSNICYFPQYP